FLVLLLAREFAPRWIWPLAAYNLSMALSLVYLGEHYVSDVVGGIVVATMAVIVARRIHQRTPDGDTRTLGLPGSLSEQ
ncbi:MAG: phosphatase PAP2 family protein, partial [Dehalococcoidia bacterium]